MVMVRTPQMIPGVAEIDIRSDTPGVREMKATPLYIVGSGSKYPPAADTLEPAGSDGQTFAGKLWLMDAGSWQVRIQADGALGSGELALPVPAYARNTLPMQRWLGAILLGMLALLIVALVAIVGAARREGALIPGVAADKAHRRGAWRAMGVAFALVIAGLAIGNTWWDTVAADNTSRKIYQPPSLGVSIAGNQMTLRMADSAWHIRRPETVSTTIIPDHGHLMHLFLVSEPAMDRMYHLHPRQDADDPAIFTENVSHVEPGHYKIFADIVRASGFPDTMVAEAEIPAMATANDAGSLGGDPDDSEAVPSALAATAAGNVVSPLDDGARMVWERAPGPLVANSLIRFQFRVQDAAGKQLDDLQPYMGMAAHAEFITSDFSVFAHVHPDGSVSMAALDLANAALSEKKPASAAQNSSAMPGMAVMPEMNVSGMSMAGMEGMSDGAKPLPGEISFPYGFPKRGLYRIFVQVKRKGKVETGVFDASVN
jgi:hypothetical protein